MSDGKYFNITECAVTGDEIAAGDRIVKRAWGTYAVAARVQYTPELEEETEARLKAEHGVVETVEPSAEETPAPTRWPSKAKPTSTENMPTESVPEA